MGERIEKWLDGKRTYLTVLAILVVGLLTTRGIEIPEYVWAALAAAGLGFMRAAIKKAEYP